MKYIKELLITLVVIFSGCSNAYELNYCSTDKCYNDFNFYEFINKKGETFPIVDSCVLYNYYSENKFTLNQLKEISKKEINE